MFKLVKGGYAVFSGCIFGHLARIAFWIICKTQKTTSPAFLRAHSWSLGQDKPLKEMVKPFSVVYMLLYNGEFGLEAGDESLFFRDGVTGLSDEMSRGFINVIGVEHTLIKSVQLAADGQNALL